MKNCPYCGTPLNGGFCPFHGNVGGVTNDENE